MDEPVTDSDDADLDWQGHVERSLVAHWRRRAEAAYRAIGRLTGTPTATLDDLLRAIEADDDGTLPSRLRRVRFPEDGHQALILLAGYDQGRLRVRLDRQGPAVPVGLDGAEFESDTLAKELAEADALAVPRLRVRLAEAGIDPVRAAGGDTVPGPDQAAATGALSNMRLDGVPHDLVLTDEGLLFVPCPTSVDKGRERLRHLLTTPDGVAGIARLPDACWLPFEDLAAVWILKETPVKARVTRHDGTEAEFGWTWIGEELGESSRILLRQLQSLAALED